jgi:hypothetical protein
MSATGLIDERAYYDDGSDDDAGNPRWRVALGRDAKCFVSAFQSVICCHAINSSGMKLAAREQGSRIFESMRIVGRSIHRGPKSTFNTDQTYD